MKPSFLNANSSVNKAQRTNQPSSGIRSLINFKGLSNNRKSRINSLKMLVLFTASLTLSNCVMANQDGDGKKEPVLSGSVSDATSKKPVKGVTIFITSSGDRHGKSFITDEQGKFIIPRLPAGEVTIVLEKKGYKTYRKEKIILKEGMQVKLQFDISNENEEFNLFQPLLRMMES